MTPEEQKTIDRLWDKFLAGIKAFREESGNTMVPLAIFFVHFQKMEDDLVIAPSKGVTSLWDSTLPKEQHVGFLHFLADNYPKGEYGETFPVAQNN